MLFSTTAFADSIHCEPALKKSFKERIAEVRERINGKKFRRALAIISLAATTAGVVSGTPLVDSSITWDDYFTEIQDTTTDYRLLLELVTEDLLTNRKP